MRLASLVFPIFFLLILVSCDGPNERGSPSEPADVEQAKECEHGLPAGECTRCNRAPAAAPVADWCAGHGLPESKCTKCNPSLLETFRASGDFCKEHGFPESVCPVCNPQPAPAGAKRAATEARVV